MRACVHVFMVSSAGRLLVASLSAGDCAPTQRYDSTTSVFVLRRDLLPQFNTNSLPTFEVTDSGLR